MFLEEKKGDDIILLDIIEVSDFTDYFVICSGTSERMIHVLAEDTLRNMRKAHNIHAKSEGESRDGWVLVDFDSVVLHVMSPEKRNYYKLEELWSEGKVLLHLQ